MSQLDGLLGNEALKQRLSRALAQGTLPHAVLLAAPNGCGRNFAARCLAADYLFPNGGAGAAAVMRGESPEVLALQGQGRAGHISVEQVRAARSGVYQSALSAKGRVVLVHNAQQLTVPAANALLKVLEEPPAEVLLVLTAHDAAALPATIRSRCALYPLAPVAEDVCRAALQKQLPPGADEGLPALLAVLYGGRIGSGLAVLGDAHRLAVLQHALAAVDAAAEANRYAMLAVFSRYEARGGKEEEKQRQRALRAALLQDMADALACGLRSVPLPGHPALAAGTAAAMLPAVNKAREALAGNVAPKLLFAALCARLHGALQQASAPVASPPTAQATPH